MNVEVEGSLYHSAYDPEREAAKFYESYPIENADFVLHFGWGLGYSGDVLKSRIKPTARVIVFEPDEELFKFSFAHMEKRAALEDERFQFVVGSQLCRFFDEWRVEGCQEADQFLWLVWPNATRHHANVAVLLQERFKVWLRDRAANLLTHFKNGALYFQNALTNFKFQSDADVGILFNRFRNVPLVIVSAGPSLDRNIRELRGFHDRCFIMAVDTAMRPLLAAGIAPHAVVIADPTELNAEHVVGAVPDSVYLIAEQAVDPSALHAASRRFLFGVGLFPDSLAVKFGFVKSSLEVWGSVSTAALDLACKLGANPIIFAGQDFSYAWGRNYAQHTIFDDNPFDARQPNAPHEVDIWGRKVATTENLIAYRDFFVRKIRQTAGPRFINATEGGILREGVEVLSLRDALARCSKRIDVSGRLRRAHSVHATDGRRHAEGVSKALRHLSDVLETRASDCGCLDGYLELAAKEALLKKNDDELNRSMLWGWRICEQLCRTHAQG